MLALFGILALLVFGNASEDLTPRNPINTPSPMLKPSFPRCEQFGQASAEDTCGTMIGKANIPKEEFLRLNPAMGAGCDEGKIVPGHFYCFMAMSSGGKSRPVPKEGPNRGKPPQPKPRPKPIEGPNRGDPPKPRPNPRPIEGPNRGDPPRPKPIDGPNRGEPPKKTKTTQQKANQKVTTYHPMATRKTHKGQEYCTFDDCWKSWVKLSTGSEEWVFTSATSTCSRLATKSCDFNWFDFPEMIKGGCNNCDALRYGCACMTDGLYHTSTWAYVQESYLAQ